MKTRYKYPCVFSYTGKNFINYHFPDFPYYGAVESNHITLERAIPFAHYALERMISKCKEEGKPLPDPSNPENISINEKTDKIVFIEVEA